MHAQTVWIAANPYRPQMHRQAGGGSGAATLPLAWGLRSLRENFAERVPTDVRVTGQVGGWSGLLPRQMMTLGRSSVWMDIELLLGRCSGASSEQIILCH